MKNLVAILTSVIYFLTPLIVLEQGVGEKIIRNENIMVIQ